MPILNSRHSKEDIQYWRDALSIEVQGICSLLESIEQKPLEDRLAILERAEKKLCTARDINRTYKHELSLADHRTKWLYETKLSKVSDDLDCCLELFKSLEKLKQHDELFVDTRRDLDNQITEAETGDIIISDMNSIQDTTKSSLHNTKRMVAASKEIANVTNEELARQREHIGKINDHGNQVDETLTRSDKLLKTLNRLANDRIVRVFTIINTLLVIGMVVYMIVKKISSINYPSSNPRGSVRMLRGLDLEDNVV